MAIWPMSNLVRAGSCSYISNLSIEHFRRAKKLLARLPPPSLSAPNAPSELPNNISRCSRAHMALTGVGGAALRV
jgi:hypothetical protein